jgi:hypothetical protein
MFIGADMNYTQSMSSSAFNENLTGQNPGFTLGYDLGMFGLEVFSKKIETEKLGYSSGLYDITINDDILGGGFYYYFTPPYFLISLGYATHNIEATYTNNSGTEYDSTIDGEKGNAYIGLGGRFTFGPVKLHLDIKSFRVDENLGFVMGSAGLSYYFGGDRPAKGVFAIDVGKL